MLINTAEIVSVSYVRASWFGWYDIVVTSWRQEAFHVRILYFLASKSIERTFDDCLTNYR